MKAEVSLSFPQWPLPRHNLLTSCKLLDIQKAFRQQWQPQDHQRLAMAPLPAGSPLTTPGPDSAADCSSAIYMQPAFSRLLAFDPWYGEFVNISAQCLPEKLTELWSRSQSLGPGTVLSLGPFACPRYYTTATVVSVDLVSSLVACCPS